MKNRKLRLLAFGFAGLFSFGEAFATNPLIMDQFTADPTARVFEGEIYVYPSHDIPVPAGSGVRTNWFCMEDYHVFSSENLTDWTDHGVILDQTNVPWLNRKSYNMWAPDCVFKNGKYYFYFPDGRQRSGLPSRTSRTAPLSLKKSQSQARAESTPACSSTRTEAPICFGQGAESLVAKLKDNMVELDSQPQTIDESSAQEDSSKAPLRSSGMASITSRIRTRRTRPRGLNTQPAPTRWDLTSRRE